MECGSVGAEVDFLENREALLDGSELDGGVVLGLLGFLGEIRFIAQDPCEDAALER